MYRDFEVIVVNDGMPVPKEDIEKFIHEKAPRDVPVKIIHHETNRSALQAKITGCLNSSRKYLIFMDDDDELSPETLKNLRAYFLQYNPDIITFNLTSPQKKLIYKPPSFSTYFNEEILFDYFRKIESVAHSIAHCSFRREICLKAIDACPALKDAYINMLDDSLLGILFFSVAKTYIKDAGIARYIYHLHEDSITAPKNKAKMKEEYAKQKELMCKIAKEYLESIQADKRLLDKLEKHIKLNPMK